MHYLLRKQIVLLFLFLIGIIGQSIAQKELYRMHREDQPYYFGITLGYNSSYLHLSKSQQFIQNNDTILVAEPGSSGGIVMGLLATARLNDHFQFRVNPQLIIGGARSINYVLGRTLPGESSNQLQSLPSTLVSFPFQFKFNSDRIGNFRTYILGGLKYDIDLSSNSGARNAEDLVKLKRGDFGLEAGIGFNFYLPFVTVSPEIKISYGLGNIHQVDPALKYSNILDRIQSRMIVFSIHLED
jgi:Outer membrane protein beta-barrel domain